MKFIKIIEKRADNCGPEILEKTVMVNPHAITKIVSWTGIYGYHSPVIVLCTADTDSNPIITKFTSVETAADYVQQASSMSIGVS